MNRVLAAVLMLWAAGAAHSDDTALVANDAPPRGTVVDPVVARSDPSQRYALYVPSGYTSERRWPLLVVLDARGRGRFVAERFRAAAEARGWIVASSNDTRSDRPWEPNLKSVRAILADADQRFAIDPRRIHFAGLSGNARGAWAIASAMPQAAGVIVASGGFPFESPPTASLPFPVFATAGTRDFNYLEMQGAAERLESLDLPHRLEVFEGGHEWPPEALCGAALEWLDLRAMRTARSARDEGFVTTLHEHSLTEARALEAAGKYEEALARYRELVRDFTELADVGEASAAARRLADSGEVETARDERRHAARWEEKRRADAEAVAATLAATGALDTSRLRSRTGDLIHELRARAEGRSDPQQAEAAARVLEHLHSFLGFYLPRTLATEGRLDRAVLSLELALEIHGDAASWYELARLRARAGSEGRALDALEEALARGSVDRERLPGEPDFRTLREEERFQRLVAPGAAAPPP